MPTAIISYEHVGDAGEVFALSVTSSIVTPAIIHGVHGNWGPFGLSLGLRIPGALLFVLGMASSFESHDQDTVPISPFYLAGAFTMLTASLIDSLIAFDKPEGEGDPKARAWTVSPWASPRDRAGGLLVSAKL